ncbi:cytochrome c [Stratiformator vulcanicus]|uniref:Cytochrome c n=1 Tax=Stratiformator vulcanicus TaxID=2527980 RepID=A0A517R3W2_9PLAN|nr:cytochrome c [Stratiformator vulcanicus]QDT38561.1 Cytochrome c [Stratiformator vulcanicus]
MCSRRRALPFALSLTFVVGGLSGCGDGSGDQFTPSEGFLSLPEILRDGPPEGAASTTTESRNLTDPSRTVTGLGPHLNRRFGTLKDPRIWKDLPLDFHTLEQSESAVSDHAAATDNLSKAGVLFRKNCAQCHGSSGAGDGPSAKYFSPRPRDYRPGIFKFTSTGSAGRPSRSDLEATIRRGIPGTNMPSFDRLADSDIRLLVEYVRWLSMRGELELALVREVEFDFGDEIWKARIADGESEADLNQEAIDFLQHDLPFVAANAEQNLIERWSTDDVDSSAVSSEHDPPPDTPQSRRRGELLFLSQRGKCVSCHGKAGRGDGPLTASFHVDPRTGEEYPQRGLHDVWGDVIVPRDLTGGAFGGGDRPVDLYRRIAFGINGTPMPAYQPTLDEQEIWDLVHYVRSLSGTPIPVSPSEDNNSDKGEGT